MPYSYKGDTLEDRISGLLSDLDHLMGRFQRDEIVAKDRLNHGSRPKSMYEKALIEAAAQQRVVDQVRTMIRDLMTGWEDAAPQMPDAGAARNIVNG